MSGNPFLPVDEDEGIKVCPTLDDCPTLEELNKTLKEHETKQTRLMRNRASAKLSRERQRQKLRHLSERCHFLENKNRQLAHDNMLLYKDNVAMHNKLNSNKKIRL